jgi:tetratricopeptide (TPR) repeat protein
MLDHYAFCPCGSGKKVKFCCSNDLLSDLDRIFRLVEGQQLKAALDQINNLMSFKGRRPALLALKGQLQIGSGDAEGGHQTINEWLQRDPRNFVALTTAANACALRGDLAGALERMSRVLEYAESVDVAMAGLLTSIQLIARLMLENDDVIGAHAYLSKAIPYFFRLSQDEKERHVEIPKMLRSIRGSSSIVPIAKQIFEPRECPETVVWRDDFRAALELFSKGVIWKACEAFESLANRFPSQPSILWNLAVLRLRLGNPHLASLAWRAFATLPAVSADEAVEALTVAEYLEPRNPDVVELVVQEYPLSETDRVTERMLSDRRLVATRDPIEDWDVEEDGPPPKAAFLIGDRPVKDIPAPKTFEECPHLIGRILVFGRQTDRAARLELTTRESDRLPLIHSIIRDNCGDALGMPTALESIGKIPLLDSLRGPAHAPVAIKADDPGAAEFDPAKLRQENVRHNLTEVWVNTPLRALDGKTPREAVNDPVQRLRLAAIISLAAQQAIPDGQDALFDEVREKVGLPAEPRFSGAELDVLSVPFYRFSRIDAHTLSDVALNEMLVLASDYNLRDAKRAAAFAVLDRSSITAPALKSISWKSIIETSATLEEAIKLCDEAILACQKIAAPIAVFKLQKLQFLILSGDAEGAIPLVTELQRDYADDKPVQAQLFSILKPFVRRLPDGRIMLQLPSFASPEAAANQPAAAKPSGLWTPDQGPPVASAAAAPIPGAARGASPLAGAPAAPAKSKLWIPGMD